MIRRLPMLVTLTAFALLLGGCGQTEACTDVGTWSGITFEFGAVVARHGDSRLVVKACVQATCASRTINPQHPRDALLVGSKIMTDVSPLLVTLTMTDESGRVVFDGEATVTPRKVQPNGAGCPPIGWNAQVNASGVDRLAIATAS